MIKFEYLSDRNDQYTGLRFRSSLDPDTVLVFTDIFEGTTFDSEYVQFPFSIIALDENDVVLKKASVYPPEEYFNTPPGTYTVIEGVVDFCERNNVEIGRPFPYNWRLGLNY